MNLLNVLVWLACALVACTTAKEPRGAQPVQRAADRERASQSVRWFGALREIMHEGRTQSAVTLSDVVTGSRTWGLGALAGLHGEVTIVAGVAWLARPTVDGRAAIRRAELNAADREQGAALLVIADVATWQELTVERSVPWRDLDGYLEEQLRRHDLSLEQPVALRIEGPMAELHWHVIDGSKLQPGAGHMEHARSTVRGVVAGAQEVQLVGFFSRHHQGVFTHAGAASHFHALVQEPWVSGHVDSVELRPGARLLFAPARVGASAPAPAH